MKTKQGSAGEGPSRDAIARMFARLTADRDDLRSALERCQERLDELEEMVTGTATGSEPASGAKALSVAEEALATAKRALATIRSKRKR